MMKSLLAVFSTVFVLLCLWMTPPLPVVAAFGVGVTTDQSYRVFVSTPTSKYPKRTVGDCCQRTFLTLSPSTTVDEAMDLFLSLRVQGAPVVNNANGNNNDTPELVGMVSQFDFLNKEAFGGALLPLEQGGSRENLQKYVDAAKKICATVVQDVMTTTEQVVTITPSTSMQDAAEIMKRHKFHQLPVVEEEGSNKVIGLLTSEDVMRDLLHVIKYLPEGHEDVAP